MNWISVEYEGYPEPNLPVLVWEQGRVYIALRGSYNDKYWTKISEVDWSRDYYKNPEYDRDYGSLPTFWMWIPAPSEDMIDRISDS